MIYTTINTQGMSWLNISNIMHYVANQKEKW
uniref:Uncharacterized protein n=1 Tax=Anguilla anguilla TaxID=7936 RepID=A0A0E9XFL8_ANGAN